MLRRSLALALVAACGDAGGFPDAAVPDAAPTGTFSLTWSVIDENSAPLACDRIAAQTMTALPRNKAFEGGQTQIFTCKDGTGTSQAVVAGVYDVDFELSGTFGLLARGGSQMNIAVPAGGNVELSPVTFQVKATGGVAFQLASGKPGGNCGTSQNGGAGIDGFSISIDRTRDQTCTPLTLNISQGATQPASTYTVDCTTPVVTGCIEADQYLTATGISSDAYTMRIKGKIGTKDCWLNNDTVQVPPLDITLSRTLNLVQQTQVGGCGM